MNSIKRTKSRVEFVGNNNHRKSSTFLRKRSLVPSMMVNDNKLNKEKKRIETKWQTNSCWYITNGVIFIIYLLWFIIITLLQINIQSFYSTREFVLEGFGIDNLDPKSEYNQTELLQFYSDLHINITKANFSIYNEYNIVSNVRTTFRTLDDSKLVHPKHASTSKVNPTKIFPAPKNPKRGGLPSIDYKSKANEDFEYTQTLGNKLSFDYEDSFLNNGGYVMVWTDWKAKALNTSQIKLVNDNVSNENIKTLIMYSELGDYLYNFEYIIKSEEVSSVYTVIIDFVIIDREYESITDVVLIFESKGTGKIKFTEEISYLEKEIYNNNKNYLRLFFETTFLIFVILSCIYLAQEIFSFTSKTYIDIFNALKARFKRDIALKKAEEQKKQFEKKLRLNKEEMDLKLFQFKQMQTKNFDKLNSKKCNKANKANKRRNKRENKQTLIKIIKNQRLRKTQSQRLEESEKEILQKEQESKYIEDNINKNLPNKFLLALKILISEYSFITISLILSIMLIVNWIMYIKRHADLNSSNNDTNNNSNSTNNNTKNPDGLSTYNRIFKYGGNFTNNEANSIYNLGELLYSYIKLAAINHLFIFGKVIFYLNALSSSIKLFSVSINDSLVEYFGFLVLYITFTTSFAILGMNIFRQISEFKDFGTAFSTMLTLSAGTMSDEAISGMHKTNKTMCLIYFGGATVFFKYILLKLLLAIMLNNFYNSYEQYQLTKDESMKLSTSDIIKNNKKSIIYWCVLNYYKIISWICNKLNCILEFFTLKDASRFKLTDFTIRTGSFMRRNYVFTRLIKFMDYYLIAKDEGRFIKYNNTEEYVGDKVDNNILAILNNNNWNDSKCLIHSVDFEGGSLDSNNEENIENNSQEENEEEINEDSLGNNVRIHIFDVSEKSKSIEYGDLNNLPNIYKDSNSLLPQQQTQTEINNEVDYSNANIEKRYSRARSLQSYNGKSSIYYEENSSNYDVNENSKTNLGVSSTFFNLSSQLNLTSGGSHKRTIKRRLEHDEAKNYDIKPVSELVELKNERNLFFESQEDNYEYKNKYEKIIRKAIKLLFIYLFFLISLILSVIYNSKVTIQREVFSNIFTSFKRMYFENFEQSDNTKTINFYDSDLIRINDLYNSFESLFSANNTSNDTKEKAIQLLKNISSTFIKNDYTNLYKYDFTLTNPLGIKDTKGISDFIFDSFPYYLFLLDNAFDNNKLQNYNLFHNSLFITTKKTKTNEEYKDLGIYRNYSFNFDKFTEQTNSFEIKCEYEHEIYSSNNSSNFTLKSNYLKEISYASNGGFLYIMFIELPNWDNVYFSQGNSSSTENFYNNFESLLFNLNYFVDQHFTNFTITGNSNPSRYPMSIFPFINNYIREQIIDELIYEIHIEFLYDTDFKDYMTNYVSITFTIDQYHVVHSEFIVKTLFNSPYDNKLEYTLYIFYVIYLIFCVQRIVVFIKNYKDNNNYYSKWKFDEVDKLSYEARTIRSNINPEIFRRLYYLFDFNRINDLMIIMFSLITIILRFILIFDTKTFFDLKNSLDLNNGHMKLVDAFLENNIVNDDGSISFSITDESSEKLGRSYNYSNVIKLKEHLNNILLLSDYYWIFINILMINASIRLLFMFNFSKYFGIIIETIKESSELNFVFLVILIFTQPAFIFYSYFVFGPFNNYYSSLGTAFIKTLTIMLGDFNFQFFYKIDNLYGTIFCYLYIIIINLIILNMFVATIDKAYNVIKIEIIALNENYSIKRTWFYWIIVLKRFILKRICNVYFYESLKTSTNHLHLLEADFDFNKRVSIDKSCFMFSELIKYSFPKDFSFEEISKLVQQEEDLSQKITVRGEMASAHIASQIGIKMNNISNLKKNKYKFIKKHHLDTYDFLLLSLINETLFCNQNSLMKIEEGFLYLYFYRKINKYDDRRLNLYNKNEDNIETISLMEKKIKLVLCEIEELKKIEQRILNIDVSVENSVRYQINNPDVSFLRKIQKEQSQSYSDVFEDESRDEEGLFEDSSYDSSTYN